MTLIDYTWDDADTEQSVHIEQIRQGYRISEAGGQGLVRHAPRIVLAVMTLGAVVATGLVWMLDATHFLGASFAGWAAIAAALCIVCAALLVTRTIVPRREVIEVDLKGRVLNIAAPQTGVGFGARKTIRFEEITRIDLAETTLMTELKSALNRWDYGRITLRMHGKRPLTLIGGDMAELEPLLRRLRGDAGVA